MNIQQRWRAGVRRRLWRAENGNLLVITALLLTTFIGIMTLVIDVGLVAGQRRFMQNGADAAALAAARRLAGSVSPYPASPPRPIPHFFGVSDAAVRAEAFDIASQNQNAGVTGRTTSFTVLVEYCVAANDSSYNFAPDCPSPNSWVAGPTGDGRVPDGAYKVRVTVASTITNVFGGAVGLTDSNVAATATAVIHGVCPQVVATGNIWPFTLWDQQDFGTVPSQLYQLWGSTAPSPPFAGAWQNVLDLTPARKWCDGNPSVNNPDYKWTYPAMIPDLDQGAAVNCSDPTAPLDPTKNFAGTDTTWYRDGYAEDPRGGCYVGSDRSNPDLAIWAATTFQGSLRVRQGGTPGNKMPTYQDAQPGQGGNGGQNVATGIYGPGPGSCATTFFFQNQTAIDPDYPQWGPYREVVVFTYDNPEYWTTNSNSWSTNRSGAPGRVELIRILHFRIYQNYDTANSRIWGRVVSPVFPPSYDPAGCPIDTLGPGIYGNIVRLGD